MNGAPGGPTAWTEVARLRQGLYRLLGATFLPPTPQRLDTLSLGAQALADMGVESFPFHTDVIRLLDALQQPADPVARDVEHVRLFGSGVDGALCPPIESFYLPGATATVIARLERDYSTLGLSPRRGALVEPDHVAGQLEALSVLCSREAEAWMTGDPRAVADAVRRERWFLQRHPARWVPQLSRRLRAAGAAAPYAVLAAAVASLVVHDQQLLASLAREIERQEVA